MAGEATLASEQPMKTVAVIGASTDRSKFSNKAVRAYVAQGWNVYPVNPKGGVIEGVAAYASVKDIPAVIDRVTIYLPPPVAVAALPDIASVKPKEFFVNPGAESDELVEKARALGLDPILACSIVDIGVSPSQFPG
jgi:predicted CoA-binding protein